MRKIILLIMMLSMIFTSVYASVETEARSEGDLKVSSRVNVTSYNKPLILKTPKVDESEKVYDFAELFTDEEEKNLYKKITSFIKDNEMDMAVVTINENNKSTAEKYADDFYDYNYFGVGTKCDGLLFLIDMDTREMYISTTGEAIRVYNDSRINNILDTAYNKISKREYYDCVLAFVGKSNDYAMQGIPDNNVNTNIDEEGNYIVDEEYGSEIENTKWLMMGLLAFVISGIIIWIIGAKHKTVIKATTAKNYLVQNSINIYEREDTFLTTHTSRVLIRTDSSSSGGGSSTHSGSSGISHGGGGRHF